jgi:lipopolysaccharide transport system ATP-binding protein
MSEPVIHVERLGKRYRIGESGRHKALRHLLGDALRAPVRMLKGPKTGSRNGSNPPGTGFIWALKDIGFGVRQGEVLGLIGRNGAGKSTLLKILARITRPTQGYAEIRGRVGSLLEVGTGFHPELTGRENVYMSGAILGMRKAEIERKFDEIVDFAGVERFLEMPLKHYSSGMQMRLAFAVAAHLEPEILLVDEVLAVGDIVFQKKCLGKMQEVSSSGRTIIFVSHNMGAVSQLCGRCAMLDGGLLKVVDSPEVVIGRYLADASSSERMASPGSTRNLGADAIITECWLAGEDGRPLSIVDVQRGCQIALRILVRRNSGDIDVGIQVRNSTQVLLFTSNLRQSANGHSPLEAGENVFFVCIPGHFLAPGNYSLTVGTHRPNVELLDFHEDILRFQVEETGSDLWQYKGANLGNILVRLTWRRANTMG